MKASPLVSVLMTAYNREHYIGESIESVLASTYANLELIIVDDGSKDNTVVVAKKYASLDNRVHVYVNEQNLGDYPNRNKAASYAKGEYIKYVDSDDIMYPYCLDAMTGSMEQFPEAGFGLSSKGDAHKPYPVMLSSKEAYLEHFYVYGHFNRAPGSAIIRKAAFDKVGGFSGERMIGDHDLWFRMAMYYPMVKFSVDLYWSRMHEGQESQTEYAQKEYLQLHKMILDRYFKHPDCPLNEDERNAYLQKLKKDAKKSKVKNALIRLIR